MYKKYVNKRKNEFQAKNKNYLSRILILNLKKMFAINIVQTSLMIKTKNKTASHQNNLF